MAENAKNKKSPIHEVECLVDRISKDGTKAHIIPNSYPAGITPFWLDAPLLKQLRPDEAIDSRPWLLTITEA